MLILSLKVGCWWVIIKFYLSLGTLGRLLPLNAIVGWFCLYIQLSSVQRLFAFVSLSGGLDIGRRCVRISSRFRIQLETAWCTRVVCWSCLFVRRLLLPATLLVFTTLRSVSGWCRSLNLGLELWLLCMITLIWTQSYFILTLSSLFRCCLTSDCRFCVWKVWVSIRSNSIARRSVENLRNMRSLGESNRSRTTWILINPWFA